MADFSRVLMVVNPISGGKDKTDLIDEVKTIITEKGLEVKIFLTTGKEDKEALRKEIEKFDPQRILSIGGDGTIKLISEILTDDSIPVGIFPAGSANGLAENLDLPTDIRELTEVALGDNFVHLDTILVNEEFCLHISDIGLNAELIKNYQEGNIRGKLGYLIQSIPTLINSDFPFEFNIEVDGKKISRKAVLIAIANAKKYGTGANINPNGRYDDGKFEILIFKEFNIPQILKTFREQVEIDEDFLEILPAVEARISSNKNIPFQIDGEYRGDIQEVRAIISPVKMRIAVP
jgi:diacylglycerol kinase (ATP)